WIGAFADIAGGRLHRDHVPGEQEAIGDIDLEPVEVANRGKEARSVDVRESRELAEMHHAWMEDPGYCDEGQRDHRQEREDGSKARANTEDTIGGNEEEQESKDGDEQR